ncbi:hypothetical protein PHMEG_00034409, partial [Phytophthora megakarya]
MKSINWTNICTNMEGTDAQLLMEEMKVFIIVKSQLVPCDGTCGLGRPHKMRYQLLRCSSETCRAATPYDACPWIGKVLTCQEINRVAVKEHGMHETQVREPAKPALTPRLKEFCHEMATQGLKPARIRNGMGRPFGIAEDSLPELRKVQWFVNHFAKTNLHKSDDYDDILEQISQMAYEPGMSDTNPFSFGWQRDSHGKPDVGNGSDEHPFLVGLTTKRLLRNAARDPASFVFHMDATFKLNQVGYPVIVCGILDKCHSFHPVALFITSQRLTELYIKALRALRKIFTTVTGEQMLLRYVMADAEVAQQNAVDEVFGVDSDFTYLMCFYLMTSQEAYDDHVKVVLAKWDDENLLTGFKSYFNNVWVLSESWRWQCFHTPSGYATTNNPVEQFNRLIKRDYTL